MSDTQEDIITTYSPEEINSAMEDLKNMTPEDLLSLRGALDRAIENITLPEAVAICFTEVYTPSGTKISVTCRGVSGKNAIDELANTLRYIQQTYNMHTSHPVQSEPQYVQDEQTVVPQVDPIKTVDIDVIGISRERKQDGKGDFLRVKGGVFTRYGAPAYDNIFPKTLDITKLNYGVEMSPTPDLAHARVQYEVNKDGKMSHARVIQFL